VQYTRPRTSCKICPFNDHKRVYSELVADGLRPTIAIVGGSPGREENRDGKPFVGPIGKLVNWALANCDIRRSNVYCANAVCCHPTDAIEDSLEMNEAMRYCRAGLYDELIAQYDRGLRVVIALGQHAMKQLGLDGKLQAYRGSLMEVELPGSRAITVIPTYHPSVVMAHNWRRSNGGTAKATVEWLADWKKAAKIASEGGAAKGKLEERFVLDPSVDQIEQFVAQAVKRKSLVAIDIETSGLGFDNCKIVVIGLATSSEDALCVPILTTGAAPVFTNGNWERVKNALKLLFSSCPQVYQNSFFDVPRLRAFGIPVPYRLVKHDTMLLSHTLHCETPHDLGFIVSLHGRTPYWKEEFKNRSVSIFELNQLEMRRYNLRDCVVLHQILESMLHDLKELNLESIYYDEVMPLLEPVMEMTQYGVAIDLGRVRKYKLMLEAKIESGTQELYALGSLPSEFNVASTSQMRWFLFSEPLEAFKRIDERDTRNANKAEALGEKLLDKRCKISDIECLVQEKKSLGKPTASLEKRLLAAQAALEKSSRPKPQTQIERDIEALRVVRDTVRPLYTLPGFVPPTTESGLLATDKEGLLSYKIALVNRRKRASELVRKDGTDEVAAIDRLLGFMQKLGEVGLYRKLLSTYTVFQPWNDSRIHAYWKQHGTASGRLAATNPNLMNLPRIRENPDDIRNPIRSFFIAPVGSKLISADYVNLEAQLLAYSTLEPELVDVFTHGLNLHDVNTRTLFGIGPESPGWKSARAAAKIDFFGNKCYGGSDSAIYRKIMLEVPDLNMTFGEYAEANRKWFEAHKHYAAWATRIRSEVRSKRCARTPFGRVRYFLDNDRDIEKEALNHMIQSSGASLVNRAMIRIERRFRAECRHAHIILQIHDELVAEAPDAYVEQAKAIIVEEMSRPFEFLGFTRSIPVDATVGQDLGLL